MHAHEWKIAVTAALLSGKSSLNTPTKRRASSALFEDDNDAENIDPSMLKGSSKRSKVFDGTPKKTSRIVLSNTPRSAPVVSTLPSNLPSSTSLPSLNTSITPISARGGSPKHKRVGLLSKRRASNSPFSRIDPPSFSRSVGSSMPFSLDAALSGTISTYTPKSAAKVPTLEDTMPKSWFFDIHVDTPEEEATNLMEHSACILDISSDDDCNTKLENEMRERGKENIPPPDHILTLSNPVGSNGIQHLSPLANEVLIDPIAAEKITVHAKGSEKRNKLDVDAMIEDRTPLSALPVEEYYAVEPEPTREPESSNETVQTETQPEKAISVVEETVQVALADNSTTLYTTEAEVAIQQQEAELAILESTADVIFENQEQSTEREDIVVFEDHAPSTHVQEEVATAGIESVVEEL
jgi:hypothetical protein